MKTAFYKTISFSWILLFFLSSCNFPNIDKDTSKTNDYPQAEVVFQVTLPEKLEDGVGLYLEILDEVTGVYFNPDRFAMNSSSDKVYLFKLPLTIGAEVNYRYLRTKEDVVYEVNSRNQPVLFRKIIVEGPLLVQDTIFGWTNQLFAGVTGRITGQLIDSENQAPIPDMVIYAAGMFTTSSSDGTFLLENVPVGTHNVVVVSKESSYSPFQQYATISQGATTPILLTLTKREMVKVIFVVTTREKLDNGMPIRIAGNIASLGNKFELLQAGSANTSNTLPQLVKQSNNKYSTTLNLPAGSYIKYKYTLGDGFWNSELNSNGSFILREILVPSISKTISDTVNSFDSPGKGEVVINAIVTTQTPSLENLFIQLNPYDWMEPIPMIKTGPNTWKFILSAPLQLTDLVNYRYCRDGDCSNGLSNNESLSINPSQEPIFINDAIESWSGFLLEANSPIIDNGGFNLSVNPELITGVELSSHLPSTWESSVENGFKDVNNLGSKWVIISPTWSLSLTDPVEIEPNGFGDLSWTDTQKLINYVNLAEMDPVLFPQLNLSDNSMLSGSVAHDNDWWLTFFARYERFILNYADMAQIMGAKAIVLGDPILGFSMYQENVNEKLWPKLVADVRERFSGEIIGFFPVPNTNDPPDWLNDVDLIYISFSPTIIDKNTAIAEISSQLDTLAYPLIEQFEKPILIGGSFPSNEMALEGCHDIFGSCFVSTPNIDLSVDLDLQATLYNAFSVASISKNWISGLITRGYYPFIPLNDLGSSIYGKPSYDVLWFWFHFVQNLHSSNN